jgi:hypothetical protein
LDEAHIFFDGIDGRQQRLDRWLAGRLAHNRLLQPLA